MFRPFPIALQRPAPGPHVALVALALIAGRVPAPQAACLPQFTFTDNQVLPLPAGQRFAVGADLNGDSVADIVVGTADSLFILKGAAQLPPQRVSYTLHARYPLLGLSPTGAAVADFNSDGRPDIAVSCEGGTVRLFNGNAPGGASDATFTPNGGLNVDSNWDVASGDITGDGVPDLVVSMRLGTVGVWRGNNGGLGGSAFTQIGDLSVGRALKGLRLVDLDLDGYRDVVVGTDAATVAVFYGQGQNGVPDGTFGSVQAFVMAGVCYDVAVADFNADGFLDIASANYTGQSVSVLPGIGNRFFRASITHALTSASPLGLAAGDFDDDGDTDLVVSAAGSGASFLFLPNSGTYSAGQDGLGATVLPVGPTRGSYRIGVADLDSDGRLDVMVPGQFSTDLFLSFSSCLTSRKRLLIVTSGPGTVERVPDQADYTPGDTVRLIAHPAPRFVLSKWSAGVDTTRNPPFVFMDADRTVTATFALGTFLVDTTPIGSGEGIVARSPTGPTYLGGTVVTIVAHRGVTSRFVGWLGDTTSTDTVLTITVTRARVIRPQFDVDPAFAASILAVRDVPLDQGGQVVVRWRASPAESFGMPASARVTSYWLWRAVPSAAARGAHAATAVGLPAAATGYAWELLGSRSGGGFAEYSMVAATASDSGAAGNPYTAFLVQSRTAVESRWYDSTPDSGYSVDNLPPLPPRAFGISRDAAGYTLHWSSVSAPDFFGYELHRLPSLTTEPSPATLVAVTGDTSANDPVRPGTVAYVVAALDVHGNHSAFVRITVPYPQAPLELAFVALSPNPAPAAALSVRFVAAQSGRATLELLDLGGRRVHRTFSEGAAGERSVTLRTGLRPGLYWLRLTQGNMSRTRRVTLLE